ncbi:MAG: TetR family transcriptional regulator [Solirubrobacterales bacterium]
MEAAVKLDKREALLEAAIMVIASQGMRGLTHRGVETEAGLPHGSTTYYFGTRHDLVVALMRHVAEKGRAAMEPIARQLTLTLADRSKELDIDNIADGLIAWIDVSAQMELARYELQVTGARDEEMKQLMTDTCDVFRQMCEPIAIACGSKDPLRDSSVMQAAIDGFMFKRLTNNDMSDEAIKRGIRILLEGIGND